LSLGRLVREGSVKVIGKGERRIGRGEGGCPEGNGHRGEHTLAIKRGEKTRKVAREGYVKTI